MVYLCNEMTHNNETNERLLHTETSIQKKKLGVEGFIYSLAAFNKVLEHAKLIHGDTSQSSGGEGSPWEGLQGKPFTKYLDHLAQDVVIYVKTC